MMDWNGEERRAANLAAAEARPRQTVDAPIVILIVGFAAVVLFQLTAVAQHVFLAGDQRGEAKAAQEARRQISCFVIGTAQGRAAPDLLTTCGFLKIGGD